MGDPRIIADAIGIGGLLGSSFTIQRNDQSFDGTWSKPDVPLLIFADHHLDGALYFHEGPMAGAPGGHPLQLIFWGEWWKGPGAAKCALVEARTKALLESVYFSELAQYGTRAPNFRGANIVSKPAPPSVSDTPGDLMEEVLDLIDDLIDADVFPDPDDGPRFIFVVLLPDTLTLNFTPEGMHSIGYDIGFPINDDSYWAGWVAPKLPVDPPTGGDKSLMIALSHEVVETLTDPEGDAWCTDSQLDGRFEISDAGFSVTPTNSEIQTAFVNGVHVQSYWSARHNATIIPIDRDYKARLTARVREVTRHVNASGTFRPEPGDSAACSKIPQCCIEDRDYEWRAYAVDEVARITLLTERFRRADASWTVNGESIGASRDLQLELDVETFAGRTPTVAKRTIKLKCTKTASGLEIKSSGGNFEVIVECAVRERDVTGNLNKSSGGLIATPKIRIGFEGSQVLLEDAYVEQRTACIVAMLGRYQVQYKPDRRIRPEEGINWDPGILFKDLPAYVRPSQYEGIKWLARWARAAQRILDPQQARLAMASLRAEARALSRNIDVAALRTALREGRRAAKRKPNSAD
jgi:hypothetical protein